MNAFFRNSSWLFLFLFVVVFSVFLMFWQIQKFPQDLDGEFIEQGIGAYYIIKSKELGIPVLEIIQKNPFISFQPEDTQQLVRADYIYKFVFAQPLNSLLIVLVFKFLGVANFSLVFLGASLGFLTILATYSLGSKMYGSVTGFFASFFLATSLFFILTSRTGYVVIPLMSLVVTITIFLFYVAHKKNSVLFLYLSAFALAIQWQVGVMGNFLLPAVLFIFALISSKSLTLRSTTLTNQNETKNIVMWQSLLDFFRIKNRFNSFGLKFKLKFYIYFLAIFISSSLVLNALYSLFLDAPLLTSTAATLNLLQTEGPKRMGFGLNFNNFINFWRELFWGMLPYNKGGGHESAILAGSPMMNIFAFLFFLIGIIRAITRRSLADKICLVWIGVTIFTFSVLSVSHPRYILFGAPAFYLLSGLGFVSSWQLISQAIVNFKNFKLKILSYSALLLIFSFTLIYSFYWIYQDFFIKFPKVGINNTYYQGSKELADYILNNFDPKKDQLVFSDLTLINYEIFFFNTLGNFYPVISWYNIIQNLSDDSKALQYADFVSWRANTYQAMQSWEEKILTEKEKIIYIFSASPGYPYYFSLGGGLNEKFIQNKILDNFYELHLGIKPQKIIYYPPGNPHYAIFIVDRNTPRNYFWNIGENKNFLYQVNDTKELKTFFIKFGFPQNLKIATNSQYLEFPLGQASSNLKKVAFASSGKSFLTFEASFSKEENFGSFEAKNLKFYQQKNNSLKWVELSNNLLVRENGGYMTYKINSPYNITHLEVNIYYTFFNDLEKENEITLYYSLDNKNYQEAFRIKSDGSKNIIGPGADFSGEIKNLNSKEFYLKFVLRGKPGQVQLWSIKDLPISFIAKTNLDSFPGLKLTKVENLLKIIQEKEDKDLRIIF